MRTRIAVVPGLLMLLSVGPTNAQQEGGYLRKADIKRAEGLVTVVSNHPRPLEQVLEAVLPMYGWWVDYEEPPYQSSLELFDPTAGSWKASHPNGPRTLFIRGGAFRTDYRESEATADSPQEQATVIRKIVSDYNASGNPGQFEVRRRADGRLQIVGVSVKEESGLALHTASVLDTLITMPIGSMPLDEAFDTFLEALNSRSAIKVRGIGPKNMFHLTTVTMPGREMLARTALLELLSQAKIRTYWMMLYEPDSKDYFLTIRLAMRGREFVRVPATTSPVDAPDDTRQSDCSRRAFRSPRIDSYARCPPIVQVAPQSVAPINLHRTGVAFAARDR
jgi:hypothetical protein